MERTVMLREPPAGLKWRDVVANSHDTIRNGAIGLAMNRVLEEEIPGAIAELGVYRGKTSRLLRKLAPDRTLYLFDTFKGFPEQDLPSPDKRFSDTTIGEVQRVVGDLSRVEFRAGYFPETARGLEDERFAFVMLDVDLFAPTLAGLEFFYPRMAPGGYIFSHDYHNHDPNFGVRQAFDEFLRDKPESFVEIPDLWGTVVLRRTRERI
jgi:O-methyltransferase